MARAIKLINAPVGLFDIDGVLVLKTEYSTQHEDGAITPDCYIVDSGEYFWGGVDSVEERNNLMVTPIDMPTLTPPDEPLTFAQLCEMDGNPVFAVIGGIEPLKMWTLIEFVEEAHCVILTNNLGGRTEYYSDKELKEDGLTIYRYPPKREKNASPDLISRSALLEGETEPEITTGSDSELAEHMEWERWMDKIKRAPAAGKEEES